MTDEQIRLVRESFRRVVPVADAAAGLFYARLFDLDPGLEPLFKGDIVEQGRKLMKMLGMAVVSLDRPEQLLPAVRAMGARHVGYGVRERDYDTVGRALLWMLKEVVGDGFTPEAEAAWAEVYVTLAAAMQAGAAPVAKEEGRAYAHLS